LHQVVYWVVIMGGLIVVAGVPGTGKTSVSRELALLTGFTTIELGEYALEKGFILGFDDERKTYVIDEERLAMEIARHAGMQDKPIIVSTHYPEILQPEVVDKVFVLRTHPLVLEKRLMDKGWDRRKISENIMAEILGVVAYNAVTAFGEDKVYEIDTSNTSPRDVAMLILGILRGETRVEPGIHIDWLSTLPFEVVARFDSYE